jgi:hypothetical protein
MKKYLAILALTTLSTHAQQPTTLQERLLIQQTIILQEQNDHLQYIEDQIRRAVLLQNLQDQRARKELPLMPQ